MQIFTIGHSTRTFEEFAELLEAAGVATVADVRRFPASRRYPHFNGDALEALLRERGVDYRHLPELGGRRRLSPHNVHRALRNDSFRAYAEHMEGAEFREGVARVLELTRPALLCAEAVPWRCHRNMISDHFVAHGTPVLHLVGPGATKEHLLSRLARIDGDRLVYDVGAPPLQDELFSIL